VLRNPLPQRYWQYNDKRPALYSTIGGMQRVLVTAIVTKNLAFSFLPTGIVFSKNTVVFPYDKPSYLALLQSNLHEAWARKYSSTLETRLNYSPTDCFETFPFPVKFTDLEVIGEQYHTYRRNVMLSRNEGLTKVYNRVHDQGLRIMNQPKPVRISLLV
jgi:hypothetical protein